MLLCHICLQSICSCSGPVAQRQRPGGRGHVSELPTLVTVQWVRLGAAAGSAEEERAVGGGGGERVLRVQSNRRK